MLCTVLVDVCYTILVTIGYTMRCFHHTLHQIYSHEIAEELHCMVAYGIVSTICLMNSVDGQDVNTVCAGMLALLKNKIKQNCS